MSSVPESRLPIGREGDLDVVIEGELGFALPELVQHFDHGAIGSALRGADDDCNLQPGAR